MVSTTTEPPTRRAVTIPNSVSSENDEGRKPWRKSTVRGRSPFDSAIMMKSSSRVLRVSVRNRRW